MSPTDEHLEQLFAVAKNLPAELSVREVEMTFLNPALLPPAKPWYGGYPKLFTMLSFLLALAFAVTLSGPTGSLAPVDSPPAEITLPSTAVTMPSAENIAETPDEEPEVPAPALTNTAAAVPQLPTLAQFRVIAPTAAPTNPVIPPSAPSTVARAAHSPASAPDAGDNFILPLPSPVFSGDWKLRKNLLQLSLHEITSDDQEQHFNLPASLTGAETMEIEDREVASGKIERAAGTILLHGNKKRGTFEFIPNAAFRDRLNAGGMGDLQLPEGENPRLPVFSTLTRPGVSSHTDHPRDLLWLKYFINNVNDGYLQVLYDHGYTDDELVGLYHLPDYGVKRLTLINLLTMTDHLFAERVPMKDLALMSWRITYLSALIRNGHTGMMLEEFWSREDNTLSGPLLPDGPYPLSVPLLGTLGEPILSPNQPIVGMKGQESPLLSGRLSRGQRLLSGQKELPENWGMGTPGRVAENLDITTLTNLTVKGNIRLYLNYSDAPRKVVVFASPAGRSGIAVRQSGKKLRLANTNSKEPIDVEVSGPLLKRLRYAGIAVFFNKASKRQ